MDIFDHLSEIKEYPRIIILNYLSIEYLIKYYISCYKNSEDNFINPLHSISTFNQITFRSKVNTLIKTIPYELQRNKYGYYSENIYDRILKFEDFMKHFISYNLFDYVDIDQIITQELRIDLKNEDESDDEIESFDHVNWEYKLKNTNKTKILLDPEFKYSRVYNIDSIGSIIESIIEIFMLNGYSETDYKLKSFTLNSLTKPDYMILFNDSFIIDI